MREPRRRLSGWMLAVTIIIIVVVGLRERATIGAFMTVLSHMLFQTETVTVAPTALRP